MTAGFSTIWCRPGLLLACAALLLSLSISPARGRVMLTGAGDDAEEILLPLVKLTGPQPLWACEEALSQALRRRPHCCTRSCRCTINDAERFQVGFRDLRPNVDEGYGHRYYYQVPKNARGTVVFIHAVSWAGPL